MVRSLSARTLDNKKKAIGEMDNATVKEVARRREG